MTRLFLSLYFVVALAIIVISWSTEFIWRQTEQINDQDIQAMAQLATLVPVNSQGISTLEQQAKHVGLTLQVTDASAVAFLPEQQAQLSQGQALIVYDESDSIFIHRIANSKLLTIGPITTSSPDNLLKTTILVMSYIFLAVVILFWSWPLWRDLVKLTWLAKQYGRGRFDVNAKISSSSVIQPVSQKFSAMAAKISRLIADQQLMFNAVSHDIRTPLTRLKFSVAMLPQDNNMIADEMTQDINEIETLLDDILNYGRLDTQQQNLKLSQVNISQLLINQVQKQNSVSPVPITLDISGSITWQCDGHLLERAFVNVITNAMRYSKQLIKVSVAQQNNNLLISIEDDGTGISEQDREKIFLPFNRLDTSRNKAQGGFGLGLAIVQRIMQWHQGECKVTDSKLGGAKFILVLPQRIS